MSPFWLEVIGYAASALVLVSLMMRSVVRLRIINLLGALTFTLYGVLISAYPVAIMNGAIVFVNLYYLRQMRDRRDYFRLLELPPDDAYLRNFLALYAADIQRFAPGFHAGASEHNFALLVLQKLVPAGVLVGTLASNATLDIALDYVLPPYRDLGPGRFIYHESAGRLRQLGVQRVQLRDPVPAMHGYLEKIGFVRDSADFYTMRLDASSVD